MKNIHSKRFYDIDLLRFLAAMSVVFFHYTFRGGAADGMSILSFNELSEVTKYGYLGVNIFFMVSGFVILMSTYTGEIRRFMISRFTRLYPTFWVCVLMTSLISTLIGEDLFQVSFSQVLLNLTMTPTIFNEQYVDGVYWTLLIELKFYFLIMVVMLLGLMKYIKTIAFVWAIWSLFYYFIPMPYRLHGILFPEFSSYFIAGAMFFLIRHEGVCKNKIIIILLSYVSSVLYVLADSIGQIEHFQTNFSSFVLVAIISLFYLVMFMIATGKSSFVNRKIFYYFGAVTYPLYLLHQNNGYMVFNYLGNSINKYTLLFSTLVAMLLLSYIVHILVEKRFSVKLKEALFVNLFRIRERAE